MAGCPNEQLLKQIADAIIVIVDYPSAAKSYIHV